MSASLPFARRHVDIGRPMAMYVTAMLILDVRTPAYAVRITKRIVLEVEQHNDGCHHVPLASLCIISGTVARCQGFDSALRSVAQPIARFIRFIAISGDEFLDLQVSPERQLSAHRGKPSSQQPLPSEAQKPPELRELSLKTRSLERGVPASVSSPSLSLLADDSQRNGVHEKEAVARDNSTKEEKMQRAMSWSQAPAIISRMTSWKEAGKDYNAMQVCTGACTGRDKCPCLYEYAGHACLLLYMPRFTRQQISCRDAGEWQLRGAGQRSKPSLCSRGTPH